MARHIMDHTPVRSSTRVKEFLRLARSPRETWHRPQALSGATRLMQFLRIARGRQV